MTTNASPVSPGTPPSQVDEPVRALERAVQEALGPDGPLSLALPGFAAREAQGRLALAVARCLADGGVLVAEAGTGVGKTYAYLLPALLSARRVLIATATRNLQDQLSTRDLPRLMAALGLSRRVAQLKGRASYLCRLRLRSARRDGHYLGDSELHQLARVERWAQATRSGDLAELPELDESSALLPLITSTRDNCLGSRCADWQACHVNEARRLALAADVVVINHHLFFADQQLRESGVAELLPTVHTVIFDEAHRLNDIGVQFLGRQVGTRQLRRLATDLLDEGMRWARGFQPWPELASLLEREARALDQWLARALPREGGRLRWLGSSPEGIAPEPWARALDHLAALLQRLREALQVTAETAPELRRLEARVLELQQQWAAFMRPPAQLAVRWLEVGPQTQTRWLEAPLEVSAALQSWITPEALAAGRSWVFTSATLGLDDGLSWFTGPAGLQSLAQVLRLESPFDYRHQACLHVPEGLPDAQDPDHAGALAQWLVEPVRRLGGRTLVLATSRRALAELARSLAQRMAGSGIELLVQGQGSRRRLLERFRAGAQRPCVLLASGAFWEGVDVPGPALQMLVIDKLPFPVPDDPLVQARSQVLRERGLSPFEAYALPEAAMALKQGAGRLIRSETDRGVLVVADERLLQRRYGDRLRAALPSMPLLSDHAALLARLDSLRQTEEGPGKDPAA